ncbi:MAG: DNA repair protein RecN [Deltaproteobacteria bacterium]|uniref:DNA repair protein RecN n=1 Tax=Candidatus Acidulodesulfobacterium acidiphilum TaxID=2597224 RepID=A0A520XAV0_9DELT|nr:DNA repair protein RecN [Deltaproteobacteria bacterium]MDA8299130.1 DNA repair protein RecN [Deltaproteobacteria bacterium]RZV38265.1 MAG: DNA repair protein RecN [Candidatus Acidulodesulfobacterium acidiphilum]
MLKTIKIKNFATIDFLEIAFCGGLNVLSGETGAGKSIIIESLNFLFGKTKGLDVIRTGEKEGYVTAVFDLNASVKESLNGIFAESDVEGLIDLVSSDDFNIKRTITESGKSRYFINGEPVNKNLIEKFGENLLKIFGQNDRRFLIDPASQLAFLDDFSGNETLLKEAKKIYSEIKKILSEKEEITRKIDGISRIRTLNSYIVNDVENLNIKSADEEEILKQELKKLENANAIKELILNSIDLIDGDEYGILKSMALLVSNLSKLSELDSAFKKTESLKNAETAKIEVEDILLFLEKYSALEFDEDRLNEIRLKIDSVIGIENKYNVSGLEELIKLYDEAKQELGGIAELERRISEIDGEYEKLKENFLWISGELHAKRIKSASIMEKQIEKELLFLKIKPIFKINIDKTDFEKSFSETGLDDCIFMFSANPGEEPRALSKVASGGELSRISLCILKILNKRKDTATFIFDEIDAGIGGDVANFVGSALKSISEANQVILITHLAQVSSFADRHFFVYKEVISGKTYTRIKELNEEERITETARMLSGDSKGEAALMHAREILKNRGGFK